MRETDRQRQRQRQRDRDRDRETETDGQKGSVILDWSTFVLSALFFPT